MTSVKVVAASQMRINDTVTSPSAGIETDFESRVGSSAPVMVVKSFVHVPESVERAAHAQTK